jgi:hypothetical protein
MFSSQILPNTLILLAKIQWLLIGICQLLVEPLTILSDYL